ncbi:MAG: V-type ATP synthase subunit E [Eubacteriales bacterium]
MNGIEKIISRIEDDARAAEERDNLAAGEKIAGIIKNADEKAEKSAADARKRADEREGELLLHAQEARATEKRDIILRAKSELIDKAFEKALMSFDDMEEDKYTSVFSAMLSASLEDKSLVGKKTVVFSKNEKYAEALLKAASCPSDVSYKKTGDFKAGFIVKTDEIEINCTAEKLILSKRDSLCAEVFSILFG